MPVRRSTSLVAGAVAAASLALAAGAGTASGAVVGVSPPGSNDWSCTPDAAHPQPVVLVNGTFETMTKNWATMSPFLADAGYCVFAFDYGEDAAGPASGPVADSARELGTFVDAVRGATGAKQVDLVGHSQGGMMPRYWMHLLGGAKHVDDLVGIAPSNHGTEGLIVPPPDGAPSTGTGDGGDGGNALCPACDDQQAGSPFLTELNAKGDTVPGPSYTVVVTRYDEVVTPYQSQYLDGPARQVTNTLIQDKCPLDPIEHDQAPNDPVVHQLVADALSRPGPGDPAFQPACV